jgi:hypothetical protein
MFRHALVIAAAFSISCKKAPPKGELPPAGDWGSGVSGSAAPNPHAGATAPPNAHAGMPADSTHAGMPADSTHGSVPQKTAPKALEKQADGSVAMGPFTLTAPADWTIKPVTSSMRAADFMLPAKPGAEAELIVYYFGESGAGSVDDNLDRWLGQFQQPDGKKSRDVAKIEKAKFGGQDATYVSVTGHFVAPAMPGATENVDKTDQALLAAIVSSPSGPYYFKLVGAKTTVDAQAGAFRKMLESIKLR